MKVKRLLRDYNKYSVPSEELQETDTIVTVKKGGFFFNNKKYSFLNCNCENHFKFKNKYVYCLFKNYKNEKLNFYVSFNWWQYQKFLWMQKNHWLQKKENIKYIFYFLLKIINYLK